MGITSGSREVQGRKGQQRRRRRLQIDNENFGSISKGNVLIKLGNHHQLLES